jgi:hypothetical protein
LKSRSFYPLARIGRAVFIGDKMSKEIQLTQGQVAIVDDWWFEELNRHKWYAWWNVDTKSFYAARNSKNLFGKKALIYMHREIMGVVKGEEVDHWNRVTLDNQEGNLRVCTSSQNKMNIRKRSDNTSGYKGVSKNGRGWKATIQLNGKPYYLKTWTTEVEAARAYDEAAKRLHGEFAVLNFP